MSKRVGAGCSQGNHHKQLSLGVWEWPLQDLAKKVPRSVPVLKPAGGEAEISGYSGFVFIIIIMTFLFLLLLLLVLLLLSFYSP